MGTAVYATWSVTVGLLQCLCAAYSYMFSVCVYVCVCSRKPLLHYSVSACVVFCETWVLLCPAGTLIFHHAVCYTALHCTAWKRMSTPSPALFSSLCLFICLPGPHTLLPQLPHTHAHTGLIKARSSLD